MRVARGGRMRALLLPAEARRRGSRRERAGLQADGRAREVEPRGGDVVGGVSVKQRGQVLDLSAPHAQLELATAVGADPVAGAVVVGVEQAAQPPESRGLD